MKHTHLLLDETPLIVIPSLAKLVGINEAIAIQQIHWVCNVKLEHEDWRTFHDDEMWCSYTIAQWLEKMPWFGDRTCRRMLTGLEDKGILISCKPKATDWNHTKWYRVNYSALVTLTEPNNQICQNDADKMTGSVRTDLPDLDADKMTGSSISKKDIKKEIREKESDDQPEDSDDLSVVTKNLDQISGANKRSDREINNAAPQSVEQTKTDSVKVLPKRSADLAGLQGGRFDYRAIAKENISLIDPDEEAGFYKWAVEQLTQENDRQPKTVADIAVARLKKAINASPRDKELLEQYRKSLISACPNSQQTLLSDSVEGLVELAKRSPLEAQQRAVELATSKGLPRNFYLLKIEREINCV